jgi:DNA-binding Lrp family transcriptional regulator
MLSDQGTSPESVLQGFRRAEQERVETGCRAELSRRFELAGTHVLASVFVPLRTPIRR